GVCRRCPHAWPTGGRTADGPPGLPVPMTAFAVVRRTADVSATCVHGRPHVADPILASGKSRRLCNPESRPVRRNGSGVRVAFVVLLEESLTRRIGRRYSRIRHSLASLLRLEDFDARRIGSLGTVAEHDV